MKLSGCYKWHLLWYSPTPPIFLPYWNAHAHFFPSRAATFLTLCIFILISIIAIICIWYLLANSLIVLTLLKSLQPLIFQLDIISYKGWNLYLLLLYLASRIKHTYLKYGWWGDFGLPGYLGCFYLTKRIFIWSDLILHKSHIIFVIFYFR